jgi:predicted nucleotidyltransferase
MATKARPPLGLLPKEKKAVREFMTRVRATCGDKIQRAALFGSKTRKDWTEYSDVDILLIVTEKDRDLRRSIIYTAADVDLKYDVLLDVRIISAERWQYYADIKAGLYQNITKDAVPIRFYKKRTSTLSRAG